MVSQTVIARKLNVSQRTVSLCLAGSDRVAARTRQRVLEVAADMGYRPNRSAIAMRSGRFNAVALLQSTHQDLSFLPGQLLIGVQEGLLKRNLHLVLANVPDDKLTDDEFLPSVLREWSVDGFLVNYAYGFSPKFVHVIDDNHLPSIWLNTKRTHDCVYPDDIGAGRKMTEHLLAAGHKRIAFFSHRSFDGHFSVPDRYAGYEQAMVAAGLAPRKFFHLDAQYRPDNDWHDAEKCLQFVRSFLSTPDRPTAMVTYESFESIRVMLAALRLGLDVPRDLSIGTFHERPNAGGYPITTLVIPEIAMGQVALELLSQRIEEKGIRLPPRVVPFDSPIGASVAPPRS